MRSLLHLPDGLRAEASEGVGRDALDEAVLLDVPEQQITVEAAVQGPRHTLTLLWWRRRSHEEGAEEVAAGTLLLPYECRLQRQVSSGHNYGRLYAQTHVGTMLQGRVSARSELRRGARVGTYSTKPWAAEPILLRSGKTLRPVLQMVLRRKERRYISGAGRQHASTKTHAACYRRHLS